MTQKAVKNVAASIRQRLLNKARSDLRPFAELLQYYAMERFLYRLSNSQYQDHFILKGALMLRVWDSPMTRPTRDIDLLGKFDNSIEAIIQVIAEICQLNTFPDDGLHFDIKSIEGIQIKEDADYEGVRVRFLAYLDNAKINMQIDIGFGDAVYPAPEIIAYPTLLDLPAPTPLSYSKETAIAEKFEAMVKLGELNSRMKDFYDVWLLARQFEFQGNTLQKAITKTFIQRHTKLPTTINAFTDDFANAKGMQWKAFRNKLSIETTPQHLSEVTTLLDNFLKPIVQSCIQEEEYALVWKPAFGWQQTGTANT